MMVFVQRDGSGKIIGRFANLQEGYAEEALGDDDPEILAINAAEAKRDSDVANRAYLASTDWYVIRLLEIGTPIPQDVAAARSAARDAIAAE